MKFQISLVRLKKYNLQLAVSEGRRINVEFCDAAPFTIKRGNGGHTQPFRIGKDQSILRQEVVGGNI